MTDPVADLGRIPEVAAECQRIQAVLDAATWDRALLRAPLHFWTRMRRESGYASAELDGANAPVDPLVEPDHSPMGRWCEASLMVTAAADSEWKTFAHSPMQVWAHLHSLVTDDVQRGRPRGDDVVHDPLHLGAVPSAADMQPRLTHLATSLVHSRGPAVLLAAVAHAELAVLRPFAVGSYLIARATPRMVLRGRNADPLGAASVEIGQQLNGRARYVQALRSYQTGTLQGMTEYLQAYGQWVSAGVSHCSDALTILRARN